MSFITLILAIFGAAFLINLVFIGQAFAYIDMGTGSLLFQFIVGGVIGFFFTVKMYWQSLKAKWHRWFGQPAEDLSHKDHHDAGDSED